jgi:hypothetical protein
MPQQHKESTMSSSNYSTAATALIASFGKSAHQVIDMYRDGGERLAQAASQRWQAAFKEASPSLTPETRKNAKHAKEVAGRYYAQGLALSADGAQVVVDTIVGAAIAGVERVGAFAHQASQKA